MARSLLSPQLESNCNGVFPFLNISRQLFRGGLLECSVETKIRQGEFVADEVTVLLCELLIDRLQSALSFLGFATDEVTANEINVVVGRGLLEDSESWEDREDPTDVTEKVGFARDRGLRHGVDHELHLLDVTEDHSEDDFQRAVCPVRVAVVIGDLWYISGFERRVDVGTNHDMIFTEKLLQGPRSHRQSSGIRL